LKPNNFAWERSTKHNIKWLKQFFSGKCLHEITPMLVEKFKAERAKQLKSARGERTKQIKPATVNRSLTCLKSIFNRAISWGKFSGENPVAKVKFFKENNARLRYLEKDEIERLIANCSPKLKPIVIVALDTGMRKGEMLNLKWHDIDFRHSIIYLNKTKNGERREVPMNGFVSKALIAVRKNPPSEYIFPHHGDKPSDLRKSFFTACKKSGIVNFRFHDLRHTFASQLVMSGVDLNTVRELLGHKSLEMTLRYSHLSQDHKKRAVDVLGQNIHKIEPKSAGNVQEASNFENKQFFTLAELIDNEKVVI
jgi:integrase